MALLVSLAGRNRWRRAVRQRSGKAAAKAVTEYQTAVTELAFLRARMRRGAVGPHARQWHDERLADPRRRAGAGDGAAGGADRGLAAPAALGLDPAAPPPPGWRPTRRRRRVGAGTRRPAAVSWGPPRR